MDRAALPSRQRARVTLLLLLLVVGLWSSVPEWQRLSLAEDEQDDQWDEEQHAEAYVSQVISHCLPQVVCHLFAASAHQLQAFSSAERGLMDLIRSSSMATAKPSQYQFAAHFGQLIRGMEGTSCHHFFPGCPFNEEQVRQLARSIPLR